MKTATLLALACFIALSSSTASAQNAAPSVPEQAVSNRMFRSRPRLLHQLQWFPRSCLPCLHPCRVVLEPFRRLLSSGALRATRDTVGI